MDSPHNDFFRIHSTRFPCLPSGTRSSRYALPPIPFRLLPRDFFPLQMVPRVPFTIWDSFSVKGLLFPLWVFSFFGAPPSFDKAFGPPVVFSTPPHLQPFSQCPLPLLSSTSALKAFLTILHFPRASAMVVRPSRRVRSTSL